MNDPESGRQNPVKPFIIRLGDVFGDKRGLDKTLRVVTNLGFNTCAVNGATPALTDDGTEYFASLASTHFVTEAYPALDNWNIQRIIAAYTFGFNRYFEALPQQYRNEQIESFVKRITTSPTERLVTDEDILEAQAREAKFRRSMNA